MSNLYVVTSRECKDPYICTFPIISGSGYFPLKDSSVFKYCKYNISDFCTWFLSRHLGLKVLVIYTYVIYILSHNLSKKATILVVISSKNIISNFVASLEPTVCSL